MNAIAGAKALVAESIRNAPTVKLEHNLWRRQSPYASVFAVRSPSGVEFFHSELLARKRLTEVLK